MTQTHNGQSSDSLQVLFQQLAQRDIRLWLEAGQLRFDAPKGAMDELLRAELIALKPQLIAWLEAKETAKIAQVDRSRALPLSFGQERLWFLEQLNPNQTAYLLQAALMLDGALDKEALRAALAQMIERHEILRTGFREVDGVPEMQLLSLALPLQEQDWRDQEGVAEERRIAELLRAESEQPFDLGKGPLLRCQLCLLGETRALFLVTLHHIISDGWSNAIFIREFSQLYSANASKQRPALSALKLQYADYAAWQRQQSGLAQQADLDFWVNHLKAAPSRLELPLRRSLPVIDAAMDPESARQVPFSGDRVTFRLNASLVRELKQRASDWDASLFMLLFSAFSAFLHRLSDRDDLVIGIPIANREREELEPLIGFFVNSLPIRQQLPSGASFRTQLGGTRERLLDAFAHASLPFEKIVQATHPEREAGRNPWFEVLFSLQNNKQERFQLPGLEIRALELASASAKLELSLLLTPDESGQELNGCFEFNSLRFSRPTIERWSRVFQRLLADCVSQPDLPIQEFRLLEAEEERALLAFGRPPRSEAQTDRPDHVHRQGAAGGKASPVLVTRAFEACAQLYPENPALIQGANSLCYAALNRDANRLAAHLRERGIGRESVVACYLERSFLLPIALLGILKAGGVYLPLSNSDPAPRLAAVLADSKASLILTQGGKCADLPAEGAERLCLERFFATEETDLGRLENPGADGEPFLGNAATIIYTSGTTGVPKGVVGEHGCLAAHLQAHLEWSDLSAKDRVLQSAASNFDMSLEQILNPLLVGACCVLPESGYWEPAELERTLREQRVSVMVMPPEQLSQWLAYRAECPVGERSQPRYVLSGGEEMSPKLVRQLLQAGIPLCANGYGPTEGTIFATYYKIEAHTAALERVPLGRPFGEHELRLLDEGGRLCALGATGEIGLAGPLLARGYLNQPALTAERFRPDPYATEPGSRIYLSGDLARIEPDATGLPDALVFAGRRDHQVKLRGYRVECGEIEAQLRKHPALSQAAVLAQADPRGSNQLLAFVVASCEPAELRAYLSRHLPEYMVPAQICPVACLPLNANGKLDRKALLAQAAQTLDALQSAGAAYRAPQGSSESLMAEIWSEVLGVQPISRDANFFELGGHSLLATQVVSRIRKRFGQELAIRQLFENPVLSQLVLCCTQLKNQTRPPVIPAMEHPPGTRLPLSFAQERLWFLDRLLPDNPFYNMPAAARLQGPLERAALEQVFGELLERHQALRTYFPSQDGKASQVIAPALRLQPQLIDLRALSAAQQQSQSLQILQQQFQQPFKLETGPLLRYGLIQLGAQEHILFFVLHHIISDGWSMGIFLNEFSQLYQAFCKQQPSPLAKLAIQYPDFAVWQRANLRLEPLLDYWQAQLADAAPVRLPLDKPRPELLSYRGGFRQVWLERESCLRLQECAASSQSSLFMVLLAGYAALLARYSRGEDLLIGTPIANRNFGEIETLIGFFVNTLALRCRTEGDPSFRELVARVRETALEAYAHQDLPFERLVEALHPERDMSRNPLTQVTFALQNAPRIQQPELAGLRIESLDLPAENVRFDLELHVWELEGRLRCDFYYATDLFEAETIEVMAQSYCRLLRLAAQEPELKLSELKLWDAAAFAQLDFENQAERMPERSAASRDESRLALADALREGKANTVHGRFAEIAALYPDDCALRDREGSLSFRELEACSNQWAWFLIAHGVHPGDRVALCLQPSRWSSIAMLATLKCGAAYLPLDPDAPFQRLQAILSDSQPRLLLCDLAAFEGVQLARLEPHFTTLVRDQQHFSERCERFPTSALPQRALPQSPAYLIFTSGSTGRPKGSVIDHAALLNHMDWMQRRFPLTRADWVLQKTPYYFDASVWEFYAALFIGARTYIADPDGYRDPLYLRNLIREQGITILQVVPSLLRLLLEVDPQLGTPLLANCNSLRRLFCGGEALSEDLQRAFFALSNAALINLYGPTECCIDATYWLCQPERAPLIGTPIDQMEALILDESFQPQVPGIPGELYLAGPGLAQGYFALPAQSAERFLPHPFPRFPGQRIYRTGDLVRRRPSDGLNGPLEFLGRCDYQVKIHGFRMECGEIEAELKRFPVLAEAAVVAREVQAGDTRLIAYMTFNQADHEADKGVQLSHWQDVFQSSYQPGEGEDQAQDAQFNTIGWNSSYDGEPIPAAEMAEWVDQTLARLEALEARDVFEIGCGSGLLVSRLAPQATSYLASDFSQAALASLARNCAANPNLRHVRTLCRPADDFSGLEPGSFDLILLNSVIQYFPSLSYLDQVVAGALQLLRPGGRLFVGDVRDLALLEHFHTSVVLHKASDEDSLAQLKFRIQQALMQEEELLIEPSWFMHLQQQEPRIASVRVMPKRGRYHNEMTLFRYDALIRLAAEGGAGQGGDAELLAFERPADASDAASLCAKLRQKREAEAAERGGAAPALHVRALPNARLTKLGRAIQLLGELPERSKLKALRAALVEEVAFDPETLYAGDTPLQLSLANRATPEAFNLLFGLAEGDPAAGNWDPPQKHDPLGLRALVSCANNPLQNKANRAFVLQLRAFLQNRLPSYMIPSAFVVLPSMPLLPNGKLNRKALPVPESLSPAKQRFIAPRDQRESELAAIWCEVLGLAQVGVNDNFFELGGDSILSIQIVARANARGFKLKPRDLFRKQSIAELLEGAESGPASQSEQGPVVGSFAPTPVMLRYLALSPSPSPHFNQSLLLELPPDFQPELFEKTLRILEAHHDILRACFVSERNELEYGDACKRALLERHSTSATDPERQREHLIWVCNLTQEQLSPERRPLFRALHFDSDKNAGGYLFLAFHHLVIDGVSWRIFLEDAAQLYAALRAGKEHRLPAKSASFAAWSHELHKRAKDPAGFSTEERDYWRNLASLKQQSWPTDAPRREHPNRFQERLVESRALDPATTTTLLQRVPAAYHTQINEILLCALLQSFRAWSGRTELWVEMEGHGRESNDAIDLTRTLGWFTSFYPLRLEAPDATAEPLLKEQQGAWIKAVKEQVRAIPNQGLGFGVLRELAQDPELKAMAIPDLGFNYLGRFQLESKEGPFRPAAIPLKPDISPSLNCDHLIDLSISCDQQLRIHWFYNGKLFHKQSITKLADGFESALHAICAHCEAGARGFTPSDFPDAELDSDELDEILRELEED